MSETEFHVDLREYIEKILDEREKALRLTAEKTERNICFLTHRIEKIEAVQGRMIGVAIALMALSALIGAVMSHLFK